MSEAVTISQRIAEQIKTDNPRFLVKAYPASAPDNLGAGKTHVAVYRTGLAPADSSTILTHDIRLEVMVGTTAQPKASNDVDGALDEVMLSIERMPGVRWRDATYTIFDEKFPGYVITADADSVNVYKNIILEERKAE